MSIGERYNPYKKFVGAFLPNWLLMRTEVSAGAKVVFARLCQFAGERGECFPSQETLCRSAGLKERSLRNYTNELIAFKLIEVEQQGLQKPNRYHFLRHEWEDAEFPDRQETTVQDRQETTVPELHNFAGPYMSEENQDKRGKTLAEVFTLEAEQKAKKKPKAGTVNGNKPSQATIETFCESVGLPRSDGEIMLLKWNADGWPKNWQDKIRYWKRMGFMPSQKNGATRPKAASPAAPQRYPEFIKGYPNARVRAAYPTWASAQGGEAEWLRGEFHRWEKSGKYSELA